tara:strand:+ start:339 stop:500 length:162 start_codon:yes stop_codon:yes gene_type:complete
MSGKYTQRDWDRTVGWGKVPPEWSILPDFNIEESEKNENVQSQTSDSKTDKGD